MQAKRDHVVWWIEGREEEHLLFKQFEDHLEELEHPDDVFANARQMYKTNENFVIIYKNFVSPCSPFLTTCIFRYGYHSIGSAKRRK